MEWEIGCVVCKTRLWLGSQKPWKWNGFQIGNAAVMRFLALHSQCENGPDGNLLLTNDATADVPWQSEETERDWKEDILSRTFCFDSLQAGHFCCAACGKELPADETARMAEGLLKKGECLWYCNEACFADYVAAHHQKDAGLIYDSNGDSLPLGTAAGFEVGCGNCKTFFAVKGGSEANSVVQDAEDLAWFLTRHVGPEHLLKVSMDVLRF